jgi:hypothetical protein
LVVALAAGFVLSAPAPATRAQDTMDKVTCDSSLVILLYVAEYHYGFHSMYDVSTLDKGQYAPLFDAMMAMMEGEDSMMEPTPEGEMMEDTGEMMEGMTMLTPAVIEGEDQLCTDLRAELDGFLYEALTHEMMMGEEKMN